MKVSRYNNFFSVEDEKTLGINCLSGSMLILTQDLMEKYRKVEENIGSVNEPTGSFVEELRKGNFIIDDDFDELSYLKVLFRKNQFDNSSLALTILPTLNCNFLCSYCYEEKKSKFMSDKTMDHIFALALSNLKNKKDLSVTWYGGEPLLAMKSVIKLSEGLQKICKALDCDYSSDMVTNGYLLNRVTGLKLKNINISTLQVTIDGPKDIHDNRRKLLSGEGTFDKIVENILDCIDMFNIVIRMNIDSENVTSIPQVLDYFKDNGMVGDIDVYFAPTFDPGIDEKWKEEREGCRDKSSIYLEKYYDHPNFSQVEAALNVEAIKRGFPVRNFLNISGSQCSAISPNGWVIEPDGMVQKCWHTIGNMQKSVGHVSEDIKLKGSLIKWLSYDPFVNKKCVNCNILPLCLGGCPFRAIENAPFSYRCSTLKKNLEVMSKLLWISEKFKTQK